jgi:fructose/tagatose bisphosphate aldolase
MLIMLRRQLEASERRAVLYRLVGMEALKLLYAMRMARTVEDPRGKGLKPEPLAIGRTREIRDVTKIPLVLHGASGIPDDEVQAAKAAGVHKFNADTDLRHAFRQGMLDVWSKGDRQLEDAMAEGRTRMIAATVEKMKQYGCAGKARA